MLIFLTIDPGIGYDGVICTHCDSKSLQLSRHTQVYPLGILNFPCKKLMYIYIDFLNSKSQRFLYCILREPTTDLSNGKRHVLLHYLPFLSEFVLTFWPFRHINLIFTQWPLFDIIMIFFFNFNLICTLDFIFVTNFDLSLINLTLNFWTWWPTFFLWPLWPSLFIFYCPWLFLLLFLGICVGLCFLGRRFFNLKN